MLRIALAILAFSNNPAPISSGEIRGHLQVIAGPAMHGRLTMTPDWDAAAAYITGKLSSYGVPPLASSGYLYDYATTINRRMTKRNYMTFSDGTRQRWALEAGRDFSAVYGSAEMKLIGGDIVYAGYGEDSDFSRLKSAGVDLRGKVLLVLRGAAAGSKVLTNAAKATLADANGAIGIIFAGPTDKDGPIFPKLIRSQGIGTNASLVACAINETIFRDLTGKDYWSVRKSPSQVPPSFGKTVRMVTETEPNTGKAHNVIAVIPGTDPILKDEFIVIGSHLDHLGYAETGSRTGAEKIHFGADDNGSGSVGNLALARYFAQSRTNRRSIIFQWYSGEEFGLFGSAAWVKDNKDILAKTTAMVNMDMIGRSRNESVEIGGQVTSPDWAKILAGVKVPGLKFTESPVATGASDHASFIRSSIPSLFFFTGLHEEYHTEKDTIDTINFNGMAQILDAVAQTVKRIDAMDSKLKPGEFKTGGRPSNGGGESQGRRVRVGFMPEMSDTGPGVLLAGVGSDSPADKAGVKAKDRLIMFDGVKINSVEDLQAALVKAKANVAIKVRVIRAGKEIELTITPVAAAN